MKQFLVYLIIFLLYLATCTSIDSIVPLFSTRSCEYDGQQPINPQIAKIKMEIRKCCPNNHVNEGSHKVENQTPTPERIFFDKGSKCSLEMKPIIQKPGSKSSNLPPIDIPQLLSQSSPITETTRISIDNENKNSPDSGNSHNFDMGTIIDMFHLTLEKLSFFKLLTQIVSYNIEVYRTSLPMDHAI